jgi:Predicted membrane protein
VSWYLEVLRKYAQFDGRARRKEYWMFALINLVVSFAIGLIGGMVGLKPNGVGVNMIAGIYFLAVLIPSIAVGIRRLHDTGRSGWWTLIVFVPLIGALALLVFAVQDSEPGTNAWGPNPKLAGS